MLMKTVRLGVPVCAYVRGGRWYGMASAAILCHSRGTCVHESGHSLQNRRNAVCVCVWLRTSVPFAI
jgi:hypothetical protein